MKGITNIQNNIAGYSSAILAKVLINGHAGPFLPLDRLSVVGSNINWAHRNYLYFIEILTKEQALEEIRRVEAIPALAVDLSPLGFVLGVFFPDNYGTGCFPKD